MFCVQTNMSAHLLNMSYDHNLTSTVCILDQYSTYFDAHRHRQNNRLYLCWNRNFSFNESNFHRQFKFKYTQILVL